MTRSVSSGIFEIAVLITSIGRFAAFTFFFNAAADIAEDPIPASHATTIFLIFLISTPATPRLLSFVIAVDSFELAEDPIASFGTTDSPRDVSPPFATIRFTKIAFNKNDTTHDNTTLNKTPNIQFLGERATTEKKKGFISYKEEARVAQTYVERLHTATPSINQKTMFLSGGNQQKVVLAKWLYSDSDIIIFDEPTRGIDVGARREIYEIINNLVENGKTVVVISSDMEEIMGVSDRILVMYEGTIAGEIQKKDFTQDLITKYAVGEKRSVQA